VFKGYVDTSYGQIHYRMAGETGPIVFCLHESPVSSWEFEKTLPLLGARCRAIALDTPGYGQSDAPTGPLDIAGYARRMLPAIEHFAAGQKFAFATGKVEYSLQVLVEPAQPSLVSGGIRWYS